MYVSIMDNETKETVWSCRRSRHWFLVSGHSICHSSTVRHLLTVCSCAMIHSISTFYGSCDKTHVNDIQNLRNKHSWRRDVMVTEVLQSTTWLLCMGLVAVSVGKIFKSGSMLKNGLNIIMKIKNKTTFCNRCGTSGRKWSSSYLSQMFYQNYKFYEMVELQSGFMIQKYCT